MEIGGSEKAEGGLQQPSIVMRVVANHAQIVPPRVGIVFMCERKRLMPMSGYGYQEWRTEKHSRNGEQQEKSQKINSQLIMKL